MVARTQPGNNFEQVVPFAHMRPGRLWRIMEEKWSITKNTKLRLTASARLEMETSSTTTVVEILTADFMPYMHSMENGCYQNVLIELDT